MAAPLLARPSLIFTAAASHWLPWRPSHAPAPGAVPARGGQRPPLPRGGCAAAGPGSVAGVPAPCPTLRAWVAQPGPPVPCPAAGEGAGVLVWIAKPPVPPAPSPRRERGSGALTPCPTLRAGRGAVRSQRRWSPGTPPRVGRGRWPCHVPACVDASGSVPESRGVGVQLGSRRPVSWARRSPRGTSSASASRGAFAMGAWASRGAGPGWLSPADPTPLASCNSCHEAAFPRAGAVGEAISSPGCTSSHLAAHRVRVQAEITARQTLQGGWHPACIGSSHPTAPTGRLSVLPGDPCRE